MTTRYEKQCEEWNKVKDELLEKQGSLAHLVSAHMVTTELRKRLLERGEHLMTLEEIEQEYLETHQIPSPIAVTVPFSGPATVSVGRAGRWTLIGTIDITAMEDLVASHIATWLEACAEKYVPSDGRKGFARSTLQEKAAQIRAGAWRKDL